MSIEALEQTLQLGLVEHIASGIDHIPPVRAFQKGHRSVHEYQITF